MARSEYTRLRDIAQKRLGRLEAAGLAMPGLSFPKLRELKTEAERAMALIEIRQFVEAPTQVKQVRPTGNIVAKTPAGIVVDDPVKLARNERRREQRAHRREVLSHLSKKQKGWIKGAHTLGLNIRTDDIPAFVSYMEYRFSQYSDSQFYVMDDYVKDFGRAKKKQNVNSIVADFARFKADYDKLIQHTPDSEAYSAQELQKIWNQFIDR